MQVGGAGRADAGTLVVDGIPNADDEEAHRAIVQWLAGARFEPARRNGVAVAGTFRRRVGSRAAPRPGRHARGARQRTTTKSNFTTPLGAPAPSTVVKSSLSSPMHGWESLTPCDTREAASSPCTVATTTA